jgi:hypothetical protein
MIKAALGLINITLFCFFFASCIDETDIINTSAGNFHSSFEQGMDGWLPRGIDLELGNDTITWSIGITKEKSRDGLKSLKFYLENYNDAGKIWIEREFELKPNTLYKVDVSYSFATADYGQANLWNIITGALPESPKSSGDLVYQGSTGNGFESDAGYLWLDKHYEFNLVTGSSGNVYIIIGVWGTWEVSRPYYLDDVNVTFEKA